MAVSATLTAAKPSLGIRSVTALPDSEIQHLSETRGLIEPFSRDLLRSASYDLTAGIIFAKDSEGRRLAESGPGRVNSRPEATTSGIAFRPVSSATRAPKCRRSE